MNSPLTLLSRFFGCSFRRKRFLLQALAYLYAGRIALRFFPFSRAQSWFSPNTSGNESLTILEITSAIETASLFVPRCTCLTKGMAAMRLLRKSGFNPMLRFGVSIPLTLYPTVDAHAWVEVDGVIVLGGVASDRYLKLEPAAQP